jgi:hypothetical protein
MKIDGFVSQDLAALLPRETLLWKLQMLKPASEFANSRLHAVKAQTVVLSRSVSFRIYSKVVVTLKQERQKSSVLIVPVLNSRIQIYKKTFQIKPPYSLMLNK